jgi:hypothetical protein
MTKEHCKDEKNGERTPLFTRKMTRKYERTPGGNRLHRSIEEKLRKYEAKVGGYEYIPAMMHLVKRYVSDIPEDCKNEVDRRLARALDEISNGKRLLEIAVKKHEGIPLELKRRAFSPKYLTRQIEQGIEAAEISSILRTARTLRNKSIKALSATGATRGKLPGDQSECCCCCCSAETSPDQPDAPPTAPPNQYELTFKKLYCVDESDPEWGGSDEPYVAFGIITETMAEAGNPAHGVHTPVYEDVDDGDTRPSSGDQNLRLFGFAGPRAIDSTVLITATCWEHDLGDVSEITDVVRTALTAAATKAAAAGGPVGWIAAGAAVIAIGVSYLIDLIGADDQISGTLSLSLSEAQADANTSAVNPFIFPPLHFDGGDDDGIYDVYLKLRRA